VSQAFWTVLGGVTVYVLGQIAVVFYVTPIQQLWRIFGHIQHQLTYFAPAYLSPGSGRQRRRIEGVPELRRPTPRVCVCRLSLRSLRRAEDCRELTLYTWWLFHVLSSSRQLFEQRLRVLQVRRVEALIDLS
jgi:hypothetical protein